MKYRYLNEVLLDWNSKEDIQDNNIIKSSDIKKKIENEYFIYRVEDNRSKIHIFDDGSNSGWTEFNRYRDKVFINDEHVTLDDYGITNYRYDPGEYKISIGDIDRVTDCGAMFYDCPQLVSVPEFNTSNVRSMRCMFTNCYNLESVSLFNLKSVEDMFAMFEGCHHLRSVPLFDISPLINRVKAYSHPDDSLCSLSRDMFRRCFSLDQETRNAWESIYDFENETLKVENIK